MSEEEDTGQVSAESLELGYEAADANARAIFLTGLAGLFTGIFIFLILWWLFNGYRREIAMSPSHHRVSALSDTEAVPPPPRLQLNPREDFKALRAGKLAILNSAGWVDRKGGWARIPIDDAMALLVARREGRRR